MSKLFSETSPFCWAENIRGPMLQSKGLVITFLIWAYNCYVSSFRFLENSFKTINAKHTNLSWNPFRIMVKVRKINN